MKWVKRVLWAAAWGVWVWLGIGLHRELPRAPAPCIAKLSFSSPERSLGFTDGDYLLATLRWAANDAGGETRCSVWNVDDQRRLHDLDWPFHWSRELVAPGHGVFIGNRRGTGPKQGALTLYDLRTGEWRRIGPEYWHVEAIHSTLPLAAIDERPDDDNAERVLVLDFRTGQRILEWTNPPAPEGRVYIQECQFLDGDELLITAFNFFGVNSIHTRWQIHRVSLSRGELTKLYFVKERCAIKLPMQGGRLLSRILRGNEYVIEVLEFPSGRIVFSSAGAPVSDLTESKNEWDSRAVLSASGRRIMTSEGTLWDVDAGRRIWRKSRTDVGIEAHQSAGVFSVDEDWQPLLDLVGIKGTSLPATTAIRDLETGALCYRHWGTDFLHCASLDGKRSFQILTRYDSPNGTVFCKADLGKLSLEVLHRNGARFLRPDAEFGDDRAACHLKNAWKVEGVCDDEVGCQRLGVRQLLLGHLHFLQCCLEVKVLDSRYERRAVRQRGRARCSLLKPAKHRLPRFNCSRWRTRYIVDESRRQWTFPLVLMVHRELQY